MWKQPRRNESKKERREREKLEEHKGTKDGSGLAGGRGVRGSGVGRRRRDESREEE